MNGSVAETISALKFKGRPAKPGPNAVITPAQVAAIRVPTLGIVGTADPYLAEFRAMQALNPSIELVTIAGASHATAPGRSELVASLLAFLARH